MLQHLSPSGASLHFNLNLKPQTPISSNLNAAIDCNSHGISTKLPSVTMNPALGNYRRMSPVPRQQNRRKDQLTLQKGDNYNTNVLY